MMRRLFQITCLLLLATACREYDPPELEPANQVQFWMNADVNGTPVSMEADGDYQATSGVQTDSLNIEYYSAGLTADRCQDCRESFQLRWRALDEANPDINASLMNSTPVYRNILSADTNITYRVTLLAEEFTQNSSLNQVNWIVDGQPYTGDSVILTLPENTTKTKISVEISAQYNDGCTASLIDTVYLPNHGCDCAIDIDVQDTLSVKYIALASGSNGYGYSWQFKDSLVSASSREVQYFYGSVPEGGIEHARVVVQGPNCLTSSARNVIVDQNSASCTINFSTSISTLTSIVPGAIEIDLGEIELEYTDADGRVFQSYWLEQLTGFDFSVTSDEQYSDPNFQSDKESRWIKANFRCHMTDGADTLIFNNGRLSLPLGLGAD